MYFKWKFLKSMWEPLDSSYYVLLRIKIFLFLSIKKLEKVPEEFSKLSKQTLYNIYINDKTLFYIPISYILHH